MQNYLYIIVAIVIVVGGVILISKLKKSKVITPEVLTEVDKALNVIDYVLTQVDRSKAFQDKKGFIFDIAHHVVNYASQVPDAKGDKIEFSLGAVNDILAKLKVKVSDEEKKLIEIAVHDAIYSLDK